MLTKCDQCGKTFVRETWASEQMQLAMHKDIVHAKFSGGLNRSQPTKNQEVTDKTK